MTIPFLQVKTPFIKLRVKPNFPSLVTATSPIILDKSDGNFLFSLDVNALRTSLDAYYVTLGTVREKLTANRNYFVATTGSNSNDGLTVSTPFLTIAKAISVIGALDISTFNVTINVAAGTYAGAIVVNSQWMGSGTVTLLGDATTPSNVTLTAVGGTILNTKNGAAITVRGIKFGQANTHMMLQSYSVVTLSVRNEFGDAAGHSIYIETASLYTSGNEILSGAIGGWHYSCNSVGFVYCQSATWSAPGGWTGNFAQSFHCGMIYAFANSYTGTFTGQRYIAAGNGVIQTNNAAPPNYFPGTIAGAVASGGQYL